MFLGGVAGAALREVLVFAFPGVGMIPVTLFVINVIGAFALGVLLEALIRRSSDGARHARLLLGTGFLGGMTSYSSLALAVTILATQSNPWVAVAYGAGTIVLGAAATFVGIWFGGRLRRPDESVGASA